MNLHPYNYLIAYKALNPRVSKSTQTKYLAYLAAIEDHLTHFCSDKFERRDNEFLFTTLRDAFECKMQFPDYIELVAKHGNWVRTVGSFIEPVF
jgi:hypothetical protein